MFAVWTNTANDGTRAQPQFDCQGWTDPMWDRASFGYADTVISWTDGCRIEGVGDRTCAGQAALYCFQQ
jgi:hypothetical protein